MEPRVVTETVPILLHKTEEETAKDLGTRLEIALMDHVQLMEISPSGETGADAVRLAEMVLRFACGTVPIPHRLMVDKIAWGREMNRENATKYHAQLTEITLNGQYGDPAMRLAEMDLKLGTGPASIRHHPMGAVTAWVRVMRLETVSLSRVPLDCIRMEASLVTQNCRRLICSDLTANRLTFLVRDCHSSSSSTTKLLFVEMDCYASLPEP